MNDLYTGTSAPASMNESLKRSWAATKENVWLLAGFVLLYYIVSGVLRFVPGLSAITGLLSFILSASVFAAFDTYNKQQRLEFKDFFNWSPRFGRLFLGNLLLIAVVIVIMIPVLIVIIASLGLGFFTSLATDPEAFAASLLGGWFLLLLLGMLILGCIVGAFFFAYPFLVQFTDMPLTEALGTSIRIGRRYMGQIILFFLMSIGIVLLGCVALLIGVTVSLAVLFGTQYHFMRSLYPEASAAEEWDFMKDSKISS